MPSGSNHLADFASFKVHLFLGGARMATWIASDHART